ncbi:unnamed protein product, partial [Mesorhabditis belari]|uniref:Uncharacterized protein n=1 Tax=Mesorhabditis belari TaxID=2138241 RepID=A0AAF3F669_9BILA
MGRFEDFEKILLYVNAALAYIANFILIYFILNHSRRQLGTYRYLMLLFGVFNMVFPSIHILVMPKFHIYGYAFVKYPSNLLMNTFEPAHWALVIHGCFFIESQTLLAFHFVYRYILICKNHLLFIFNSKKFLPLHLSIWLMMGVIWGTNAKNLMGYNNELKSYVGETLAETYGFNVNKSGFLGLMYRHKAVKGEQTWNWTALLAGAICMSQILTTFGIISFCSYKILTTLKAAAMSEKVRKLQMELFRALLVQTLIPVLFEYMPSSIVFLGPLVKLPIGRGCNYMSIGISFYPFVDPLCILYFIRDYRNAISRMIRKRQIGGYVTETSLTKRPSQDARNVFSINRSNSSKTRMSSVIDGIDESQLKP